jgi:hypothetical protein
VSQADTLRSYQPRFDEVRHKLAQVKSLLPAAKVDSASCAVPTPLNPKFTYTTDYDPATGQSANNVEIFSERALTDPDTQVKYTGENAFEFDPTQLLQALRGTGPHGPLGDNTVEMYPPAASWSQDEDRELRTELDIGLNTRYGLVLRTRDYTPPEAIREPTREGFYGHVVMDAFVVDLQQVTLLCSFTADAEYSLDFAIVLGGESWASSMIRNMRRDLGYQITDNVEKLTGGTVGQLN